jgi:hypothetical protein
MSAFGFGCAVIFSYKANADSQEKQSFDEFLGFQSF